MRAREFEVAGLDFTIEEEANFQINPMAALTLPIALVSGLAAASYQFPEQKQAILDALTPFQIVSKVWSALCTQRMMSLADADEAEKLVFIGSWFGQQSAMMARSAPDYKSWSVQLVDKDPDACRVAQALIRCDSFHRRVAPVVTPRDVFELTFDPGSILVWNGLEHFDSAQVETFLSRHTECAVVFQSTSMPANDHVNLAHSVDDILKAVPSGWDDGILYRGELITSLGSRYMMALHGPGFDAAPIDDEDEGSYLDGPNAPPSHR